MSDESYREYEESQKFKYFSFFKTKKQQGKKIYIYQVKNEIIKISCSWGKSGCIDSFYDSFNKHSTNSNISNNRALKTHESKR